LGAERPTLSWPDHSRSEAAVKGDHRESRQRAGPWRRRERRELPGFSRAFRSACARVVSMYRRDSVGL